MNLRRSADRSVANLVLTQHDLADRAFPDEALFHKMIALERKRTERSRQPFLLVLIAAGNSLPSSKSEKFLQNIVNALSLSTRVTDVTGWYQERSVAGVMFTGIVPDEKNTIVTTMLARVSDTLRDKLSVEQFSQISISVHLYPEAWEYELLRRPSNPALYPDLSSRNGSRSLPKLAKRAMDVVGSVFALIVFAPLFAAIALAIKLTSKGTVFFRQQRVGEHGRPFIFLKFRSMYVNNDAQVHQQWFRQFVSGKGERYPVNGNGSGVFKMTKDPRMTPIGRLLRRTSLDELPQFINVLKGEMSLVGPRPPIPYEVDEYQTWHRGRVLEAKPGITGLWQVSGRSRVTFDEMVRLDVRYARTWSLWLDIKILLRTPRAVVFGEGAY